MSALIPRGISLLFLCCAAVPLLAGVPPARQEGANPAPPPEYDLKEYEAQIDRCADGIKNSADLHQLRSALAPSWHVRAGKNRIEVSTEPIAAKLRELEARPKDSAKITQDLERHLTAMRQAGTAMEASEEGENPEEANERLNKILARREFQGARGQSALGLFLARINRWIVKQLARLFMGLHISSETGNALAWGVILLAFAALCYMVWRWLSGKSRETKSEPVAKATASDARQWLAEALAAGERGDFREAIHCAYWSAVSNLEDLNILARDRARTPRESLRLLDRHPNEQQLLRELTAHFELIWYGYRLASANDWSRARGWLEKMGCLRGSTAPTANS